MKTKITLYDIEYDPDKPSCSLTIDIMEKDILSISIVDLTTEKPTLGSINLKLQEAKRVFKMIGGINEET